MKKFKVNQVIRYKGHLYRITKVTSNYLDVEAIWPYGPVLSIGPGGMAEIEGPVELETWDDFKKKVEETAHLYWTEGISERTINLKAIELIELAKLLIHRGDV